MLDALRGQADVRAVVVVTTDKVYRNREWAYPYREDDPLGGHDPYSASKAAAEIITASYRDAFLTAQGVAVATARAGNVIGRRLGGRPPAARRRARLEHRAAAHHPPPRGHAPLAACDRAAGCLPVPGRRAAAGRPRPRRGL